MGGNNIKDLEENIIVDIEQANKNDIDQIYNALNKALHQFDKDSFAKNLIDSIKKIFSTKRKKCKLIIIDIIESKDKLTAKEKQLLRNHLLDISNIHRTLIENIISILDAL